MKNNNLQSPAPQENKMGTMPIAPLLAGMAVPMMISMLVQALYNIVDSVFVAQISQDALNAVSLAFPLQNLMIAVGGGTGVGMNALLSRSLGEKRQDQADQPAPFSWPRRTSPPLWTTARTTPASAWGCPSAFSASSALSGCSSPPAGRSTP